MSNRQRTSQFMGVGSSNRKNQWQARILVGGKVSLSILVSSACDRAGIVSSALGLSSNRCVATQAAAYLLMGSGISAPNSASVPDAINVTSLRH